MRHKNMLSQMLCTQYSDQYKYNSYPSELAAHRIILNLQSTLGK